MKMLHLPILQIRCPPPVHFGLKQCFQGLLMSCMFTHYLVTLSSSEDDPVAGLLLLLALVGQNLLGRES